MIETRFVDVGTAGPRPTRLAVHLTGEGPLAVLLHGFPLDHRMWLGVMQGPLRRRRRLCAIDLRGHGQSPWSGDATHSMELFAADVVDVVRALGDEPVDLCGLSMGGYVALALLAEHPTLIRSLVLTNTRPSADTDAQRSGRAASIELAARDGRAAVAQAMLPKLTSAAVDPLHAAQLRTMIEATPTETVVADQRGMLQRPCRSEVLRSSSLPVLAVTGDEDALTPMGETVAWCEDLLGRRPEVVAGTGHMSPLEAPDAWSEVVGELWS